jgi:putative SOS response-associated peptidase YedK
VRRHVWPLPQQAHGSRDRSHLPHPNPLPIYPARYNIAPTQPVLTVKPFPAERMRAYSVSIRVNSPKNDVPEPI